MSRLFVSESSPFFEIALVLMRLDHVARFIVFLEGRHSPKEPYL